MARAAKKKIARKSNAAFMKPMTPSPALAAVIGAKPIPRTEVTQKLVGKHLVVKAALRRKDQQIRATEARP